jgi:hypothetical protein
MKNEAIATIIVARNIRNINRSKHPQQFYYDKNYRYPYYQEYKVILNDSVLETPQYRSQAECAISNAFHTFVIRGFKTGCSA